MTRYRVVQYGALPTDQLAVVNEDGETIDCQTEGCWRIARRLINDVPTCLVHADTDD